MKFKKSMLILILAVFLLSIAGVCASDVNDTAMDSQEDTVIESTDENLITVEDSEPAFSTAANGEILSASVDDEIVGAENDLDELSANPGTYSELSTEIGSGGNIVLTHDYYTYDNGTTIVISTDNKVIDGNGAIIDMAGSNIRAFNVTASGVTIKNLTIKNANVSDNGGAVYFVKEGTVENCNFVNNNVSEPFREGGAIYFMGSGNVINCNFTDNYASYGGAVYFSTNGSVSGCNFVNNSVLISGGAVCFSDDGEVTYCNFTNNSAFNGAAIFIEDEGIVENCISVNDSADYNGGAIWIANGTVENCIFVDDNADVYGGAVFFDNEGTIINCNFTNNYADEDGGAVYFFVEGEVTNCIFVNNNARLYAGALAFYYYGSVRNCNFTNNTASSAGAVLFYENGEVTNCNFINNNASSNAGAVFINQKGSVTDCIFTNNSADTGGAVRFNDYSNVISCIFVNNSAEDMGGAVYSYQNGEVTNCNFTNNDAKYGGAIDIDGDGTVETCIFVNNSAEEGGAVYIYETGEVTNCNFTNNTAATRGGVLYFSGYASVTKCNFTNNNAGDYGGAVFVSSYGDGNITNCVFVDNAAFGYYGGGIFCLSNTEVTNCNFTNNNAGKCGGAVCFYRTGEATNCNFINNSAESKAGAVYINKGGKLSNSNFTNNSAESNGGAAFIMENGIVENCNFNKNSAKDGGALFINGTAVVTNCNFTDNKVNETQGHGGAIYWNGANGNVSGCVFVNNSGDNGTIHFNNENSLSNLKINDNIFLNNDGVAIYFVKSDSASNADYNWFGNNATNYNIGPETTNVEIGTWLFLNATAKPDLISIFDSFDIVFKLYAYTPSEVSEYDNSRLKAVNLTLTPTNGRVNAAKSGLGETVHYTAESAGIGKLTASIENAAYTVSFPITDGTTFFDLNRTINGNDNDTIVLDRDYTYNSTVDYNLNEGIVIDRPLTIIGNGHTLNASGLARIFNIQANDVTINNITFANAEASGEGGAVYFKYRGTVENCNFTDNYATDYGGAIYFMENGAVKNCNFVNNKATQGDGGALYFEKDGNVTDCSFNSDASRFGGAIDFEGNGKVENCNFTNCVAVYYGGAVWFTSNEDGNGYCIVENCNFVNNDVIEKSGGAVGFYGFGIVKNCNFTNNKAILSNGGALYFYQNGTVENCNFTKQFAGEYGGAVFFYKKGSVVNCNFNGNDADRGGAITFTEYGTVENCNFTSNSVEKNGGAVYFYKNGTAVNCNFTNNSASNRGGAIYFSSSGSTHTVTNCNFTNNKATGDYSEGGAIWMYSGTVENCNFTNNTAYYGGAILFNNNGNVTNCNFINNSGEYGGAVYADANVTIEDCNFTDNSGGRFAGAVFIYGRGIVTSCNFNGNNASNGGAIRLYVGGIVTNCNFNGNNASNGGAIWLNGTDSLVSGCIFVNNIADNGTIYFNNEEYGSNFTINDNIFLNNEGVAIYFVKSDSTSNADYNWFGNNATNYDAVPVTNNAEINTWLFLNGTANPDKLFIFESSDIVFKLYAYTPSGVSEYDNSRLKAVNLTLTPTNGRVNTTVTGLGEPVQYNPDSYGIGTLTAAIENVIYTTTLKIVEGTTFYDLNYVINGNDNDTIVLDRDYTYNSTSDGDFKNGIVINRPLTIVGNGHAINAAGQARIFKVKADDVTINNITFANAKIERDDYRGGAIYWNEGANGLVSGCSFVNNSARMYGGAIYWNDADGVVSGCSFVNNSARMYGGAIDWNGAKGVVSGCSFVNNSAESYGGAIFWNTANGNVSGCSFANNSADDGGAILWNGGARGAVSGCSFVNNSAKYYGGAVYWNDAARGAVSGCSFVNNSANNRGSAIYWDSGARGVVSGCSFVNTSDKSGAIYWYANDGHVSGCSFVNNSGDKGVVYFSNGNKQNLSINDNIFLNNDAIAIYFVNNDSASNANYNWFGNTADNYDIEPLTTNVNITTWLFLNATADPNPAQISKLSDISFKLYSYNAAEISDYDSSRLQPVNLTLTATNGDVDSIAKLDETVKYNPASLGTGSVTAKIENVEYTIEMNIVKPNPNLSVESNEFNYPNNIIIALNYDSAATGKVNITLNGKRLDYAFKDLDLNATISLGIVGADEYEVTVEYSGDDIYANATATGTLTVNKANSTLTVSDIEFDYKEMGSGEISFTNATGVDAYVIGHDEAMVFIRGNTITVLNLSAGSYNLTVTTVTDANHSAVSENATVTVRKVNSTINVNDIVLYYGESVNVTITTEGTTEITAEIDGENAAVNGNVITIPADLKSGNHTLTITAVPDDNHIATNKVVNIVDCRPDNNVIVIVDGKEYPAKIIDGVVVIDTGSGQIKENTTIGLEVSSVENNATFTVNVNPDAAGIVRFEVSGAEEYTVYVDVLNGVAVMQDVLTSGDYTVVVTYMGDGRFNSNITAESFTILGHVKKDTPISADAKVNGNRVTITVNVDGNATGFVALKQSESTIYIALENGVATYAATLAAGSYNVEVVYLGDDDYNENSTRLLFNVVEAAKENTPIGLEVSSVENNATFTVSVNPDASGIVRFEVSGAESYIVYADVLNGVAVMEDVLKSGDYTVVATYMGDSRFNTNATSKSFNVKGHVKVDTPISAVAVVNGNKVSITVNVNENATGFVNMNLDGTELNVVLADGVGSITINLPASSYNTAVTYLGDGNFNQNSTMLSFTVVDPAKENTHIELAVSSVENNATFAVSVNPDASGIVRFEVSGAESYIVYADVLNGIAVMEDVLKTGDYTVVATYMGDGRFNSNITAESFTIQGHVKKDTPISADAKVNGNRVTITVNVDGNATGFVALKQSGSTSYIALENGVATYAATLAAGSYNVEVVYLGDDDYNENSTRLLFTVVEAAKENTPIELNVSSVENNATFTVNVDSDASGIVRFEVSGAESYIVYADVLNGVAVMEDVLKAGEYTVVATYMGDSRFNSNSTSKSFNVKGHVKVDTPISAIAVVNGNKVSITVNVNENATGFVNMKLADTEFNVALADGVASVTSNLPAGSYSIDVSYLGDGNFNQNSTMLSFTVVDPAKENTPIGLVVSSVENNATFAVSVNPDASGIVRFEVSGAESYTVYADVLNGVAVMKDVLAAGDYTVVATYLGDGRFNSNITQESFTISGHIKKDTPISADAKVNGNRVTITVNVDSNATGFVALKKLGSTGYIALENGVATYTVTLADGSYNVEVVYLGDDDYNGNSTRLLFTVVEAAKENTPIGLEVSSIENNATFTVNVDSDASGIVRFEVSGAESYIVYADVLNGVAVMNDVLKAGDYTVVATYMGDSKFNSNSTVKSFTIYDRIKRNTTVTSSVVVDANTVAITVNVDSHATGFIEFNIAGKMYYAPVVDGKAVLVDDFLAGTYDVDVVYLGDEYFNGNSTSVVFNVLESESNITVVVDGKEYNATVVNGTATVTTDPVEPVKLIGTKIESEYKFTRQANDWSAGERGAFFYAVLKDINGNPLANMSCLVAVNGPIYNVTTDSKGRFGVQVNLAAANTYTYALSFLGNDKYSASFNSTKLILTAKKTSISAANKVFKAKAKTKTISVTLKTVKNPYNGKTYLYKGKKITLKINGKTYTAKTNAKGVAKFKIKLTKKGKYAAKISFAGDKTYKASSKYIKVTIK